MDLGHEKGSVCTCHPVSYNSNTLERLLVHGPEAYNSYYNSHRQPSPYNKVAMDHIQGLSHVGHNNRHNTTLQSVLLGQVPAEYSHLASSQNSIRDVLSPNIPHQSNTSNNVSTLRIPNYHDNALPSSSPRHIPSPHVMASSPHSPSPRHISSSPHCRLSPAHMTPPRHVSSPLSSQYHVPSPFSTNSASSPFNPSESCQDEPIDLSCKGSNTDDSDSVMSESPKSDAGSSLLRNLLCIGKNLDTDERCPSNSMDFDPSITAISSNTRVTLAKKNMLPVSSRVSDWLVKIVQFSKSIPEFQNLSHNDKVTLILNSWTRLLLLYMSESNFQFAVTPKHNYGSSEEETPSSTPSPDTPTMKSVESVQNFVKKCQNMNLDQKEYAFLRMAVLFNAGYVGLDRPDMVDQLNSLIQQLLQEHVRLVRPTDVMHYSRLLLLLPALYGINCKMIENLFCGHINGNMDMEVLLKEMIQNL
ncbi:nuclear receptor subfamily 5 group A member 2-like [Mizuhopecten yessoensis]|uniref:Nuclear receptor subfamily 0 group B member 1 n=1 Tax=Mizuhopecten yessoensis TaxID=6573 RepID=A0A210R535_MIZYE|nr:nuclear receptor subfamily 5 group A member 2-like [Mizuhopecten yessoensis]XP_021356436.1 nuclear receptor subfamily 5 group A member 2-like [Mizuhopecten yessoensis]OWF56031.1 Nuclear receptor subfamily 0 group B member 1 [Mizuhopecten yessoensis]